MSICLRLGHTLGALRPSLTNGPGWRVSLWTQGCSLRCTPVCLNPHLLSSEGGWIAPVPSVAARIAALARRAGPLEGVTVLGGEPLDQAHAVAELLEAVHAHGLSTMVYTGHVYEELVRDGGPTVRRLLRAADVLVDGPFLQELYDEHLAWRGSRNQRLLCLTDRYDDRSLDERFRLQRKAFSIQVAPTGAFSVSGLQERRAAARIGATIASADRRR